MNRRIDDYAWLEDYAKQQAEQQPAGPPFLDLCAQAGPQPDEPQAEPQAIQANEPTVEPDDHAFRDMKLEVSPTSVIMRLGMDEAGYTTHVTTDHSADFCTCPSGTLGGTTEPIYHIPGEQQAGRDPCYHLRYLWALAPLLWQLGHRQRSVKAAKDAGSLAARFWEEIRADDDKAYQRQLAQAIERGLDEAIRASVALYLQGRRTFNIDIISHIVVEDATVQRWRSAVSRNMVRAGYWIRTGQVCRSKKPSARCALITEYAAGPRLVEQADQAERQEAAA